MHGPGGKPNPRAKPGPSTHGFGAALLVPWSHPAIHPPISIVVPFSPSAPLRWVGLKPGLRLLSTQRASLCSLHPGSWNELLLCGWTDLCGPGQTWSLSVVRRPVVLGPVTHCPRGLFEDFQCRCSSLFLDFAQAIAAICKLFSPFFPCPFLLPSLPSPF